jgi:hypothetical protein
MIKGSLFIDPDAPGVGSHPEGRMIEVGANSGSGFLSPFYRDLAQGNQGTLKRNTDVSRQAPASGACTLTKRSRHDKEFD